jgi:hypothetical protein
LYFIDAVAKVYEDRQIKKLFDGLCDSLDG